jgi:hypothetical protein
MLPVYFKRSYFYNFEMIFIICIVERSHSFIKKWCKFVFCIWQNILLVLENPTLYPHVRQVTSLKWPCCKFVWNRLSFLCLCVCLCESVLHLIVFMVWLKDYSQVNNIQLSKMQLIIKSLVCYIYLFLLKFILLLLRASCTSSVVK